MASFLDKDGIPEVIERTPHEHGWLRRPELDRGDCLVWEQPCGILIATPKGHRVRIASFMQELPK